jgi:hypothetical protein
VGTDELRAALATAILPASTLVWREGMKEWAPASSVPELASSAFAADAAVAELGLQDPAEVFDERGTLKDRERRATLVGLSTPSEVTDIELPAASSVVPAAGPKGGPVTQIPPFGAPAPEQGSVPPAPRVPASAIAAPDKAPAGAPKAPRAITTSEVDASWATITNSDEDETVPRRARPSELAAAAAAAAEAAASLRGKPDSIGRKPPPPPMRRSSPLLQASARLEAQGDVAIKAAGAAPSAEASAKAPPATSAAGAKDQHKSTPPPPAPRPLAIPSVAVPPKPGGAGVPVKSPSKTPTITLTGVVGPKLPATQAPEHKPKPPARPPPKPVPARRTVVGEKDRAPLPRPPPRQPAHTTPGLAPEPAEVQAAAAPPEAAKPIKTLQSARDSIDSFPGLADVIALADDSSDTAVTGLLEAAELGAVEYQDEEATRPGSAPPRAPTVAPRGPTPPASNGAAQLGEVGAPAPTHDTATPKDVAAHAAPTPHDATRLTGQEATASLAIQELLKNHDHEPLPSFSFPSEPSEEPAPNAAVAAPTPAAPAKIVDAPIPTVAPLEPAQPAPAGLNAAASRAPSSEALPREGLSMPPVTVAPPLAPVPTRAEAPYPPAKPVTMGGEPPLPPAKLELDGMQPARYRFDEHVAVPLSSLLGAGALLISMVIAAFFVGRATSSATARLTAHPSLAAVPALARAALPAPPKPCWMIKQPAMWAPAASRTIPFDALATKAGTLAIGYARDAREAIGVEVDLATGEVKSRLDDTAKEDIERVVPTSGSEFHVARVGGGGALRGAFEVPVAPPFAVGITDGKVALASPPQTTPSPLWTLSGDEGLGAASVRALGERGFVLVFRRAGAVWAGIIGRDRRASGELVKVAGSGGSVGKPSAAWNGREVAVIFADRPQADGHYEIRVGHAPGSAAPPTTTVLPLPRGGPGGDAFAPDLMGLPDGRWLLMWTEGAAGARAVRAQTLAADFGPLGDPIALSPPAGNFGQGVIGVAGAYAATVFLSKGALNYELWGAVLQCGD